MIKNDLKKKKKEVKNKIITHKGGCKYLVTVKAVMTIIQVEIPSIWSG